MFHLHLTLKILELFLSIVFKDAAEEICTSFKCILHLKIEFTFKIIIINCSWAKLCRRNVPIENIVLLGFVVVVFLGGYKGCFTFPVMISPGLGEGFGQFCLPIRISTPTCWKGLGHQE